MPSALRFALVGAAVALSSVAVAGNAEKLAQPYQPTLGEMMAVSVGQMVRSLDLAALEAKTPVRTFFDKKKGKIVMMATGERETVELAKKAIEALGVERLVPFLAEQYGVELSPTEDFILIYWSTRSHRAVVQKVDGHYLSD